jgi:ElaB/YqjD/DUF883 family membrane-anchored ribosome-binding protein
MKAEVFNKITGAGAEAVHLRAEVGRVKEAVADTTADAIRAAERAVKQTRRAAEDLVSDAEYQVKKHPVSSIAAAFGVGLGLGAAAAVLLARIFKTNAVNE